MSQLRYHLWQPDGYSLCRLRTLEESVQPSAPDQATVCGPCLVAAEVLRRYMVEMLLDRPYPTQTVDEATAELLSGPFAKADIADDIRRFISESGYTYPAFERA